MHLEHLTLTNFRNLDHLDLAVPQGSVLLTGANAQGKTSVLEAIYYLAAYSSFQTTVDRQLVNFAEAGNSLGVTRLVGEFMRGGRKHRIEARLILEPSGSNGQRLRKQILVDGVQKRAVEAVGNFTAVVFVPQMSRIIEGAPDERRRYLNIALSQALPHYAATLSEYVQALTQRNALLKQLGESGGDRGQLDVWDETLAGFGARLIYWRIHAVAQIERVAAGIHAELTRGAENLRLSYRPSYDPIPAPDAQIPLKLATEIDRSSLSEEQIRAGFRTRLHQAHAEELARGITAYGPHRDELRFLANAVDLGDYGSRGQIRTALLALKLAEVQWMRERTGEWPVVLLDEVMAELDGQRRADLLKHVQQSEQVLLTATDSGMFSTEFVKHAQVWSVHAGKIETRGGGR